MKEELRRNILKIRDRLSKEEARLKSKIIISKLKKELSYIKAKTVMFYVSKGNEVYTHELIKEVLRNKRVVVPKVFSDKILCCELKKFEELKLGYMGILEPESCLEVMKKNIDLVIVPGVVFDKRGFRIGHGKGFYDDFLKDFKGKKIGLAYDFQVIERIHADDWDVRVDKVISD